MSLTPEQLMIPRVMCIGTEVGTPNNPSNGSYISGDIYTKTDHTYVWCSKLIGHVFFEEDWAKKYPHLFRPMPWYEGRKPEEMPEYLRPSKTYGIVKINEWRCIGEMCLALTDDGMLSSNNWEFEPSTEAEYIAYQNSNL